MILNESIVADLMDAVNSRMESPSFKRSLRALVKELADEAGIELQTVLRREHDGCSSAEYLIEKMIGEKLAEGVIKL